MPKFEWVWLKWQKSTKMYRKMWKCIEMCKNVLKWINMYWTLLKYIQMYGNVFKCKQSSLCSLCCKLRLFGRFYKRKMSKSQYVNHLFGPVSNSKNTLVSALCTEQKSDALFSPPCTTFSNVRKTYFKLFLFTPNWFHKIPFFSSLPLKRH